MANEQLRRAKKVKNDEFYTVYAEIEKEMNAYVEYDPDVFKGKTILLPCDDPEWSNFTKYFAQNFEKLGLKKLLSTSYAQKSKTINYPRQITLFELQDPQFDESKTNSQGKIFTLTKQNKKVNINDLKWKYLYGDGDFRSDEVKALRDEADVIITNPPFSLIREFIAWITEANKVFSIIGTQGAIAYKEIFPLIRDNSIWMGATTQGQDMVFSVPEGVEINPRDREKAARLGYVGNYTRMGNGCWLTNIEHGRRHQPLQLMTMSENLKYSKHSKLENYGYIKYDNFDAIEVPFVDSIPSDYDSYMGVPPTFLQKYNPEQFEIVGMGTGDSAKEIGITQNYRGRTDLAITVDGMHSCPFQRIIIKKKESK